MAQRLWIGINNPDTQEWWLNPEYVVTVYRNEGSGRYVVCMEDGSDWDVVIDSDAGRAITDMIQGKR
jgi:hypothetical protein